MVSTVCVIDNSPLDSLRSGIISLDKVDYIHNPSNPAYGAAHDIEIRHSLSDGIDYH